ncbi:MAG: DUF5684 domain-containing protein [Eubacteriales bacterium]
MKFIETLFPNLAGQTLPVVAITLSIMVAFYLLYAIAGWKMFTKMGEKGWKAFVPVYNVYILLKRCSKVSYFGQMIIAGAVYSIIDILYYVNVINVEAANALSIICSLIQLVALIWFLVLEIKMMHGISKSFGHGAGFTVGLILLTFIFQLILGFGSSEYRPVKKGKSK